MVTPAFYTHLFRTTLTFRADVATPACRVSSFVWKISPQWHSELCVEVASCQHHLRPSQKKKRQRGASSTCEHLFAVRSWADLPWHCLSPNFKCNSVLNSREDVKRSKPDTWKQRKPDHINIPAAEKTIQKPFASAASNCHNWWPCLWPLEETEDVRQ